MTGIAALGVRHAADYSLPPLAGADTVAYLEVHIDP